MSNRSRRSRVTPPGDEILNRNEKIAKVAKKLNLVTLQMIMDDCGVSYQKATAMVKGSGAPVLYRLSLRDERGRAVNAYPDRILERFGRGEVIEGVRVLKLGD